MSTQMKFCKDCAHHLPSTASSAVSNYDKCAATISHDLVTGKPTYKYCEYLRRANAECGLEGSLYVPAQSENNQTTQENMPESWATHGHVWIGEVMRNKE